LQLDHPDIMREGIIAQAALLAGVIAVAAAVPAAPGMAQMGTEVYMPSRLNIENTEKLAKETDLEREHWEKEQLRKKELVARFSTMSAPRVRHNSSKDRIANEGVGMKVLGMDGERGGMWIGILEVGLMMGVGLFL
jgi:hypothetical protein